MLFDLLRRAMLKDHARDDALAIVNSGSYKQREQATPSHFEIVCSDVSWLLLGNCDFKPRLPAVAQYHQSDHGRMSVFT